MRYASTGDPGIPTALPPWRAVGLGICHRQFPLTRRGVSQLDVDAFGLSLARRLAWLLYLQSGSQVRHLTILSRSQPAICGISNPNSRSIQLEEHSLNFAFVIDSALAEFPDARVSVEWTPADHTLKSYPGSGKASRAGLGASRGKRRGTNVLGPMQMFSHMQILKMASDLPLPVVFSAQKKYNRCSRFYRYEIITKNKNLLRISTTA